MTYFTAALTSPQLAKLRNTGGTSPRSYACRQLVFLCPNTAVFNARVNGAITGDPVGSIDYDTVTFGATSDIRVGQRIVISPTNNIRDLNAITCRVRSTPTGTTSGSIPINEISQDIADNSYIFVVNDYPLMDRLARPDPANPSTAQFKDYDLTYEPLPPLVAGIQMVYVQQVSSGIATFSLDASDSFGTDDSIYGLPIASYSWDFDDISAVNVIGGGLTQDNIEFEIDEGFQWGHLTIEDANGTQTVFHFQIHAWGDTYAPVLGFEGASITDDIQSGFSVSIAAFNEMQGVLDNTWMTIVRQPEYYNGAVGQLISGDAYYVEFVGFLSNETSTGKGDEFYSFLSNVSLEITGIGQRLAQIEMQAIGMRNNDAPDEWDEIDQLMPWRAVVHIWTRHSTASTLVPLVFTNDVRNTSYFYPYFATPLGGNLLTSINSILVSCNAYLEFWPNGTVEGVRDIRYVSDRSIYTTLFDIATQDWQSISITRRHLPPVGKVYAEGAFYNAVSGQVQALKSIAPGTAQQIGTDTPALGQQILTESGSQVDAQTELNQRAGNFNAISNDDGNSLTIETFGGYAPVFYASRNILYTITYSDPSRNIDYDTSTKWMCVNTQTQHNNEQGMRTCSATFVRLIPYAAPGDTIPQIAPGDQVSAIPDLAPFAFNDEFPEFSFPVGGLDLSQINPLALNPPPGQVAKKDGSTVAIKSNSQIYLLQNVIMATTPPSYEITPSDIGSDAIEQITFDPLNTGKSGGNNYGYVLVYDGTNSKVKRTSNIFGRPASWLTGDDISGLYNVIRGTNVDGGLIAYAPASTISTTVNVTYPNWGSGPASMTVGSTYTLSSLGASPGANSTCQWVFDKCVKFTVLNPSGWSDVTGGLLNAEWNKCGGGSTQFVSPTDPPWGVPQTNINGYGGGSGCGINSGSASFTFQIRIDEIIGSGNAQVRYSSDRGDTWGSAVSIGTSPGSVGGVDVSRASGVSYAAMLGKVRKATSLGGAYSDHTSYSSSAPVAICIPYFRLGSITTKQTTATDPDYTVALSTADTGSQTFYKVNGTTAAKTNITPVAGITFDSSNCITMSYGTHIAVIGVVSGDRRCYTSTDTGGTWTLRASGLSSSAMFLRTRRGDTRVSKYSGGNHGQLYIINGTTLKYSYDWGATFGNHNLPITANGMDILG